MRKSKVILGTVILVEIAYGISMSHARFARAFSFHRFPQLALLLGASPKLLAQDSGTPTVDTTAPSTAAPTTPSDAVPATPSDTGQPADTSQPAPDQSTPDQSAPSEVNPPAADQVPPEQENPAIPAPATDVVPASPEGENTQTFPPAESQDTANQNVQNSGDTVTLPPDASPSVDQEAPAQPPEQQPATANSEQFAQSPLVNTEILNAEDPTYLNSGAVDQDFVEKSKIEEQQLSQAADLQAQASLLIQYANDKVDDLNALTDKSDFATANFVAQRLDDQVNTFVNDIANLPADQSVSLKEEAKKFSEQADTTLRPEQLIVPENMEQDLEITRGKLMLLQSP